MLSRKGIELYTNSLCDVCLTRLTFWFVERLEEFARTHSNGIDKMLADTLRAHLTKLALSENIYVKTRREMNDFIHSIFELWPAIAHDNISSWIEQQLTSMKNYCFTRVGCNVATQIKLDLGAGSANYPGPKGKLTILK